MQDVPDGVPSDFDFLFDAGDVSFGDHALGALGDELADRELSRVLLVCGSNTAANADLIDPIVAALGDRICGIFDESTPGKYLGTVFDGVEEMERTDADALVSVGGGSSLDVAKAMSAFADDERTQEDVAAEIRSTGTITPPAEDRSLVPHAVVPTTFAGADLSAGFELNLHRSPMGEPPAADETMSGRLIDDRLMPSPVCYVPSLFQTTPPGVLLGSAMNGFNKAVETVYSRKHNPISDACALHALRLLRSGLFDLGEPEIRDGDPALARTVAGMLLAQYGRRTNVVHAFGHGISFYYDVQQGVVHGILTPHVLAYVFENAPARRRLLADGLGIDASELDDEAVGEAVVDRLTSLRDHLDLPTQLRTVDGLERDHLPDVAHAIAADDNHARNPAGLDVSQPEILAVLERAW